MGLQIPLHSSEPIKLTLRVKLFPQQADDMIQDITVRLFYLHIKEQILSGHLSADTDTLVSLASYQAQEKFGPFLPEIHESFLNRYLKKEDLFPTGTYSSYLVNFYYFGKFKTVFCCSSFTILKSPYFLAILGFFEDQDIPAVIWEDKVKRMHKERGTMLREDAMLFYLKIAERDIPEFGIEYFAIKSKEGRDQWLGIGPNGLHFHYLTERIGNRYDILCYA